MMREIDNEKQPLLATSKKLKVSTGPKVPGGSQDVPDSYLDLTLRRFSKKDVISIALLCLGIVCHGLGYTLISSFFPVRAQEKGLTMADIGIVVSAMPFTTLVFGLFLPYLLPKFGGHQRCLVSSLIIEIISLVPFAFVMRISDKGTFMAVSAALRCLQGVAFVSGQMSAYSIASSNYYSGTEKISSILGFLETSVAVGVSIGPAMGGILHSALGFKAPFIFLSVVIVLTLLLTHAFVTSEVSDSDEEDGKAADDNIAAEKFNLSLKTLYRAPTILGPLLCTLVMMMSMTFFDVGLAPFLTQAFNVNSAIIGLIFMVAIIIYAIASPFIGYLLESKGRKGLTLVLGCLISGLALFLLGPAPFFEIKHNIWLTQIMLIMLNIGFSLMYVPVLGITYEIARDWNVKDSKQSRKFITSLFLFMGNLGNFLGPFAGGFIMNDIGFELTAVTLGSITAALGISLALYLTYRFYAKKRE